MCPCRLEPMRTLGFTLTPLRGALAGLAVARVSLTLESRRVAGNHVGAARWCARRSGARQAMTHMLDINGAQGSVVN